MFSQYSFCIKKNCRVKLRCSKDIGRVIIFSITLDAVTSPLNGRDLMEHSRAQYRRKLVCSESLMRGFLAKGKPE